MLAFGSAFAVLCIPLGQILFGGLVEVFVDQIYWLIYLAASLVLWSYATGSLECVTN